MKNLNNDIGITKIYLVTNCYGDPNKVYIGKTKNSREYGHKTTYGTQICYIIIDQIQSLNHKEWKPLECKWIQYYKDLGYDVQNRNNGGGGPGCCSNETKIKISNKNKGKIRSEVARSKISQAMKGKNKGNVFSIESRNKIGIKTKNHIVSEVARSKISQAMKGIPKHTKESKSKISQKLKNIVRSKEFGNKISNTKKFNPSKRIDKVSNIYQYDLEGNFIKEWYSITEAEDILKINNISACCRGKQKTAGGFVWKYKTE